MSQLCQIAALRAQMRWHRRVHRPSVVRAAWRSSPSWFFGVQITASMRWRSQRRRPGPHPRQCHFSGRRAEMHPQRSRPPQRRASRRPSGRGDAGAGARVGDRRPVRRPAGLSHPVITWFRGQCSLPSLPWRERMALEQQAGTGHAHHVVADAGLLQPVGGGVPELRLGDLVMSDVTPGSRTLMPLISAFTRPSSDAHARKRQKRQVRDLALQHVYVSEGGLEPPCPVKGTSTSS